MVGLTRAAYTYSFQPDILAEIENARSLTPPEVLTTGDRRHRPRSVVTERIARLNLEPFNDNPNPTPHSIHHAHIPRGSSRRSSCQQHAVSASSTSSRRSQSRTASAGPNQQVNSSSASASAANSRRSSFGMSRPGTASNRPTHINLPTGTFAGRSPNGSPREGAASPASPRSSFLPSFMRTRSRAATVTNSSLSGRVASPSGEFGNPIDGSLGRNAHSRDATIGNTGRDGGGMTRSVSTPMSGNDLASSSNAPQVIPSARLDPSASTVKTHRIRLVPHLENSRSLAFDPVIRELLPIRVPPGVSPSAAAASMGPVGPAVNGKAPALLLKIGRFTDKNPTPAPPQTNGASGSAPAIIIAGGGGDLCSNKVAFKSKVVSRGHAEIWCEAGGKFFIKDSASSSGTFLNHIRLSSPNTESRPTALKDGDVLQLGVDYQGGVEDMYRCVKMRVELGREWQRTENEFNKNALKQLKALGGDVVSTPSKGKGVETPSSAKKGKASVTDCCICLFSVTVCQSLFIAPCSHVFHYKCIRPLLMQHHPGFSCPLCRTFANLEEDVETEDAWEVASRRASVLSRKQSNHSIRFPPAADTPGDVPPVPGPPGEPSTNVSVGDTSRSVDELLAGETTDEANGSSSAPLLQRQDTAVQQGPSSLNGLALNLGQGDIHAPVREEDEPMTGDLDPTPASSTILGGQPREIMATRSDPYSEPASEVQTPMNDTFLASLAPSVHQRLDLARQMDAIGRAATPVEEEEDTREAGENGNTSDEGWQQVDRETNGNDVEAARRDMEMMFT